MSGACPACARPTLVGCGILRNEVDFLIRKNGWSVDTHYLQSALHNYFDRLHDELDETLTEKERAGVRPIVLYGACHPRMEHLVQQHQTRRTAGQNCIVMLLGYDRFMAELSEGAYFLLEDWAVTWEPMITAAFGSRPSVVREIFHSSHKSILAIRTPCSGEFTAAAQAAADFVDLPLWWMDVDLDELERVIDEALHGAHPEAP